MRLASRVVALVWPLLLTVACAEPGAANRASGVVYATDGITYGETSYLYLLEPQAAVQRVLASGEETDFTSADISPDGTKVAFVKWRDGHREIWILPLDGSEPWPLVSGGVPPDVGGPAWSFDGRKVAFVSTVVDSNTEPCCAEFYVVDLADGKMTKLPGRGSSYAWSPTDSRIAILCNKGEDQGLMVLDTDTLEARRLLPTLYIPQFSVAWSHDATEIALVRQASTLVEELILVNVASGKWRSVTRSAGYRWRTISVIAFSPQGDKVAFVSDGGSGEALFVLDLGTGSETKVAEGASWGWWSPDGRQIAFSSSGDSSKWGRLLTVNLSTGHIRQLTDAREPLYALGWRGVELPTVGPLAGQPGTRLPQYAPTLYPPALTPGPTPRPPRPPRQGGPVED